MPAVLLLCASCVARSLRCVLSAHGGGRWTQHFAWADSLWFGEGFDYWGQSPEWWLLETSGLPFGLTGDMIREGTVGPDGGCTADGCVPTRGKGCPDPNRWLGMVFGM